MTSVNLSAQLKSALLVKMESDELATKVHDAFSILFMNLAFRKESVTPFLKINQANLGDENYDEHYIDQVKRRSIFIPALLQIGVQVSDQFFKVQEKIVELGAGDVDPSGKTLTRHMIPDRFDVVPSDVNPKIVERGRNFNPKYTLLDINHLQKSGATQFAALNVIDTLNPDQIKAFVASLESLPDGSTFIHTSDMSPMLNAFAWDLIAAKNLTFPHIVKGEILGALTVANCEAMLSKLDLDVMERNFLDEAMSNNEQVFHHLLLNGGEEVALWLKKTIPPEHLNAVSLLDHYTAKLNALSSPKLMKLFCNTVYGSQIVERKTIDDSLFKNFEKYNWIHNDKGTVELRRCYVIPHDRVVISASLIVLAIRKAEIKT